MPLLTEQEIQNYKARYRELQLEYQDLNVRADKTINISLVCFVIGIFIFPLLVVAIGFYVLYRWGKDKMREVKEEMNEIKAILDSQDSE